MAPFINGVKVANPVVYDVTSNAGRDRAAVSISRERDPRVRVGEAASPLKRRRAQFYRCPNSRFRQFVIVLAFSQGKAWGRRFGKEKDMPTITTKDGIEIFYKDWGTGQPIVFSHGWPLSADDWDAQMLFFLNHGFRVIAHDRRGHGRSTQTADGHDMDHYADDLAALTAHLDLKNAIHVGHSTGGGEVVHYLARHGESRVAKAAIISAVPPLMVKTAANPDGLPKEVFDGLQAQLAANRAQFYHDLPAGPFYGFNRPGAKVSEPVIGNWWRQGMMGGAKAHYDGIVAFSQTDFTET